MGNEIYEELFRLRVSDFDCFDRLTPCAILDLSQDIAGKHAANLHVGYDDLISNDVVWMLLRTRYEFYKNPELHTSVNVKTWPRVKGRCDFDRDTLISDNEGDIICKLQSKWVLVDVKKRRLILPRNYDYPFKDHCLDKTFDTPFDKLDDFSIEGLEEHKVQTQFLDLDHNGHINNVSYVKYALNIIELEKDYYISAFEINYIQELQNKADLSLYVKKIDNEYFIKGSSENNNIFLLKITVNKK